MAGERHERHARGIVEAKALRSVGEICRLDNAELRVGVVGESEDLFTDLETGYAFAEFLDGASEVATQDVREVEVVDVFGLAGTELPVDGVETGGVNTDEDLAGAGLGVGYVFILELFGTAVLMNDNCFHGSPQKVRCGMTAVGDSASHMSEENSNGTQKSSKESA
jgi:hypothetical protein